MTHAGAPPLDTWTIPTAPYKGAHYATWPPALLTIPIESMCPRHVCRECGQPRRRITDHQWTFDKVGASAGRSEARWQTAVEYHMYHSIGLVVSGLLGQAGTRAATAGWCFLIGIALFAGTLYGVGIGGPKWLGAITPLGGLGLMLGWLLLALHARG